MEKLRITMQNEHSGKPAGDPEQVFGSVNLQDLVQGRGGNALLQVTAVLYAQEAQRYLGRDIDLTEDLSRQLFSKDVTPERRAYAVETMLENAATKGTIQVEAISGD